nr:MAG TPA: hypothetical protein [Caudoviricetes sp.]
MATRYLTIPTHKRMIFIIQALYISRLLIKIVF